jgi:hypothetical protein
VAKKPLIPLKECGPLMVQRYSPNLQRRNIHPNIFELPAPKSIPAVVFQLVVGAIFLPVEPLCHA